jgi:hypothetical protein
LPAEPQASSKIIATRRFKMEWQVVLALVLGIPIVLFPAAYVWYLNIGGILAAVRKEKAEMVQEHAPAE